MRAEGTAERLALRSWRGIKLVPLAWISMLGFDFFLHGGLLAGLYFKSSPFLLSPMDAFRRIPIGYLSFLITAGFLVWIVSEIGARGWQNGLKAGATIGGVIWFALALGMYSISTASPILLIAWAGGQTVEMAYAGAFVGHGLETESLRKPIPIVLSLTVGFIILTIVMQSVGLAPAVLAD